MYMLPGQRFICKFNQSLPIRVYGKYWRGGKKIGAITTCRSFWAAAWLLDASKIEDLNNQKVAYPTIHSTCGVIGNFWKLQ